MTGILADIIRRAELYILKPCIAAGLAVFNELLYTSESLKNCFRHWYAASAHLSFNYYNAVTTLSVRDVTCHLGHALMTFKTFSEDCLTKAWAIVQEFDSKMMRRNNWLMPSHFRLLWKLVRSSFTLLRDLWIALRRPWMQLRPLWVQLRYLWTLIHPHLGSCQMAITEMFGRLRSVAPVFVELVKVIFDRLGSVAAVLAEAVNVLAIKAFNRLGSVATVFAGAFIKAWITLRPFRNKVWGWLMAVFGALRDNVLILCDRAAEYSAEYPIWPFMPRNLFWLQSLCLVLVLIGYFRKLDCWFMIAICQSLLSPLSQLELFRLEMVLRKTLPGSYVYGDTTVERWLSKHHFGSTLQLPKPREPMSLFRLPPSVRVRILDLALLSTAQFSWQPHRHIVGLEAPNRDFHHIWFVARSLGYVLPGNAIAIYDYDCAPASSHRADYFVPPRPSGRVQLLEMLENLKQLSLPYITQELWMGPVAASMRAGKQWIIAVRESWDHVYDHDIRLMVGSLNAVNGVGRIFPGIRVEYRIVVKDGEMEEKKKEERSLGFVRKLSRAVMMNYRDARFKVVVEGLEAWEGMIGTMELEGMQMVEVVRALVARMNEG